MFAKLACIFGIGCVQSNIGLETTVDWSTFGQSLLENTKQDGDMIIFNGRGNPGHSFDNIPALVVGDNKLERFLNVSADAAVVLEMFNNRTDFHVYDFSAESLLANDIRKSFKQPVGMNEKLGLEFASEIKSETLQITLVYDDEENANSISKILTGLEATFPTATFKCWDIIEADIGPHLFDYPAVVVSSKAHGDQFYSLQPPLNEDSILLFVEANVIKNKDRLSQEKKVFRSEL